MSIRPRAIDNQIIDIYGDLLRGMAAQRDRFAGPIAQTVTKLYDASLLTASLPAIVLQPWGETSEMASVDLHVTDLGFFTHLVVEDGDGPDDLLRELAADVKRLFLEDGEKAVVNRVKSAVWVGEVFYDGQEPHLAIAPATGRAGMRQRWRQQFRWRHDAP